jgi:hypothetical protein
MCCPVSTPACTEVTKIARLSISLQANSKQHKGSHELNDSYIELHAAKIMATEASELCLLRLQEWHGQV